MQQKETIMKLFNKLIAIAALAVMSTAPAYAAPLVVGGKDFTEQLLLAEMTTQLLDHAGFSVEKKDGMGSQVIRDA